MSAVKLASGYIELTVKKAGDAMKEITKEITSVEKTADKVGKKAGDALGKGVAKGAKDAAESLRDEITSAAKDAGADAGDAITEGVTKAAKDAGESAGQELSKGIGKGAKDAGKSVNDEITKAAKKAGEDAGKVKVEPKITPKVDTTPAKREVDGLGETILETVRKSAEAAGYSFDDIMQKAGSAAGEKIGGALHNAFGGVLDGVADLGHKAADGLTKVGDAITGIRNKDPNAVLGGISGALGAIGQSNAGSAVNSLADTISQRKGEFDTLKGSLTDIAALLGVTTLGPFIAAGAAGGVIGWNTGKFITNKMDQNEAQWYKDHGLDDKNATYNAHRDVPQTPMTDAQKAAAGNLLLPGGAGSAAPDNSGLPPWLTSPALTPPQSDDPLRRLFVPGRAGGGKAGIDGSGRLFGPGSGTSDSIIGLDANGMPTARVSAGEGVIKKSVMDRGGDKIVTALNGGVDPNSLPGFDDGGVIPPIEVPKATTGQAGGFNDWLSQQQGKAYQYGTMYDCSGFMSQIYNQMTGKQMPRFNTESDLAAYGFIRGSQAGTFQLGIHHGGGGPNSHMAGTLPDGRSVEAGGNGVQIGAGAAGAFDKQFEDHWYLPGSGGMGANPGFTGPGADGGAWMGGDPAAQGAAGAPGGVAQRTQGYIPAGAGGSGAAGSSLFSGILQNGAAAVNGLIDQAASAAATGVGAMTMGTGGGAAASAIGIGTQAAKRGVSYGFQMAGIGADALTEILMPFGVPRYFQTDPMQFMPQLGAQPTAVTTGGKAQLQGAQQAAGQAPNPALNPGGPVQGGQLPGAQPVGAPTPMAGPTGIESAPMPIGAPPGGATAPPGPAVQMPTPPGVPAGADATPSAGGWQGMVDRTPQSGPMAGQQPQQSKQPSTYIDWFKQTIGGNAQGGVVGVYDDGGWLQPGGIAINQSKRPEPVFSHEQWGSLQDNLSRTDVAALDPSSGGGNDYSVQFHGTVVKDVDELMAKADSQKRLNMMRHAGRP